MVARLVGFVSDARERGLLLLIGRLASLGLAVAAGGFAGLAVASTPPIVVVALFLGCLGGLIGFAVVAGPLEAADRARRGRALVRGRRTAGTIVVLTLVIDGVTGVFGPAAAPLLVVVALVGAPWGWARQRRQLGRRQAGGVATAGSSDPGAGAEPPSAPSVPELDVLSTPALCAAWHSSYYALRHAPDEITHGDLVALRRRYLDELERRDPDGVASWLVAESRPANTNPRRHISSSRLDVADPVPAARSSNEEEVSSPGLGGEPVDQQSRHDPRGVGAEGGGRTTPRAGDAPTPPASPDSSP